jgi:hypothetical protein
MKTNENLNRIFSKQNSICHTYRTVKSSSNINHINVKKNKILEEKYVLNKNIKSSSKNHNNNSSIITHYNSKRCFLKGNKNRYSINTALDNMCNINNLELYTNKDNIGISTISKSSKNNKTISNIVTNTDSSMSMFYKNEENSNIKGIYKKPKNEKFSPSIIITSYNSNINKKGLINRKKAIAQTNPKSKYNVYENIDKMKNNIILSKKTGSKHKHYSSNNIHKHNNTNTNTISNINTNYNININNKYNKKAETNKGYYYKKKQPEKSINVCNNLNLYSYNDTKSYFYSAKNRPVVIDNMKTDIFPDTNLNLDYQRTIYSKKKNSDKKYMKKYLTGKIFKQKNELNNKLLYDNIFQSAFYIQKQVILIQKNYRAHLSCKKKYILKALRDIINGVNKIFYIFYKNYFKKFIFIINKRFIKNNTNANLKIFQNMKNLKFLNEYNKDRNLKFKYYLKTQPKTIQKLNINKSRKNNHLTLSPKKNETKSRFNDRKTIYVTNFKAK